MTATRVIEYCCQAFVKTRYEENVGPLSKLDKRFYYKFSCLILYTIISPMVNIKLQSYKHSSINCI